MRRSESSLKPRILTVDDERAILDGLNRVLRPHFEILAAQDGDTALRVLRDQGPVSVVVADLRMPGMNGVSLLSEVKKIAPETARVLLTGHADVRSATAAVNEAGIFRLLLKPCPASELIDEIHAAAECAQQLASNRGRRERLEQMERGLQQIAIDLEKTGVVAHGARLRESATDDLRGLSPREWEILQQLLDGNRVPAIARALFISPHTVRSHLSSMFRKLDVSSQQELLERVRE